MPYRTPLTHARLYPPHQIAALVALLCEGGVAMDDALRGTGLGATALRDAACRTSIAQHQQVCGNAVALAQDPSLSFRAGASLHLSDHGLYGLLLMSCESMREHVGLAVSCQRLAAPAMAFDWDEGDAETVRLWLDPGERTLPQGLAVFLVEQQLMRHLTHLRDALGTPLQPVRACFAYPAPPHQALYSQHLQCPCVFDCERTELQFPRQLLARRPYLANPPAAATLRTACADLLAGIEASLGMAGQVHRAMQQLSDPGAGMKAVAAALKMTDRTLRRRLADEGTTFSAIAHQLKYGVAARQLTHSAAPIEQVAAIAGFSDPANFRRAFIRWAQMSPAQFRRQHLA